MKAPWINYKRMKEISSMQVNYTESTYQNELTNSIDHAHQQNSICEILNIEKEVKPPLAVESNHVANLDSNCELSIPSKTNVEEEIVHPLDTDVPAETHIVDKQDFVALIDFDDKFVSHSESDVENKMYLAIEEMNNKNSIDPVSTFSGLIYSKNQKYPFSTHVEIDDFLHAPIFGEMIKNNFEFLDLNNHLTPQLDTKLFTTTKYYSELPECRLIRTKINEFIFFAKTENYHKNSKTNNAYKSVAEPLHTKLSKNKEETKKYSYPFSDFYHIRVPVVIGEYKIEICLEENIVFEKGTVEVKDISNEVVLTDCKFIPNQTSQSLCNGTCTALKGVLFIEGYIHQNIEYTVNHNKNMVTEQNASLVHSNQLCQNIVLELIIHILQVQQIRVS